MRILFAISMLAFVGLLLASLAAARHVRRARRLKKYAHKLNGPSRTAPGAAAEEAISAGMPDPDPQAPDSCLKTSHLKQETISQAPNQRSFHQKDRLHAKKAPELHPNTEYRNVHVY
ncbi:MAG: hypothetical protein ACRYFU_09805 [Janthinobacterium lividum]